MDVSQYLDIFLDESREHLQSLNNNMLELEQNSENMDTINEIFRSAHTLKGMAGTMGFKRMQTLTHDMENVFSEVRDGNIKVNSDMIDVLFQCLDALEGYVSIIQETSDEGDNDNQPIINALNACLTGKKADAAATPAEEKPAKKSAKKSTKSKAKADTKAAEEKKEGAPAPAVSMKLSEEEQKAVEDAMMANRKLYHITVTVQDTCLLKAARAFLVFKAIEDHGEVLATNPSTQDIEDEKFDFVFQILIATDGELQPILDAIKTVSEIGDAVGVPFSGESAVSSEEPAEEEEAPAKEEDKETIRCRLLNWKRSKMTNLQMRARQSHLTFC